MGSHLSIEIEGQQIGQWNGGSLAETDVPGVGPFSVKKKRDIIHVDGDIFNREVHVDVPQLKSVPVVFDGLTITFVSIEDPGLTTRLARLLHMGNGQSELTSDSVFSDFPQ